MKIRTISQLQSALIPQEGSLFEISNPSGNNGQYTSQNITYKELRGNIGYSLSSQIITDHGMVDSSGKNLSLKTIKNQIDTIQDGNCNLNGTKVFKNIPTCDAVYSDATIDSEGYSIPNVNYVKKLMEENGSYVSEQSYIMGDPDNESVYTQDSDYFIHFRFDDNGRDSSEFILPDGSTAGYEKALYTGQLVIYGWLADNGNVRAQDAWVALYGYVNVVNDSKEVSQKWTILQVQPWIIGSKSSTLQYVSFNIPISQGMKLKIRTGFKVNGTNSGFSQPNTLTYDSWQPNSFVGYVIGNF